MDTLFYSESMYTKGTLLLFLVLCAMAFSASAQRTDSLHVKQFSGKYMVPLTLGMATLLSWRDDGTFSRGAVYRWRQENHPNFRSFADDYLQFVPAGALLLAEIIQPGKQINLKKSTVNFVKAEVLMVAVVHSIKRLSKVERPGGENFHSFPSGHTAQAFLSATYLHRELSNPKFDDLKGRKWFIAGGYVAAAVTGGLRIMNNEHWLSDVLAGAATGILAGHLAYDLFPGKRMHTTKLSIVPFWNGAGGVYVTAVFP